MTPVVVMTPEQLEDLVERAVSRALERGPGRAAPGGTVSLADAAKHLGVSTKTVRRMIADGQVGAVRVRRRVMVDLATVRSPSQVSQLAHAARSG